MFFLVITQHSQLLHDTWSANRPWKIPLHMNPKNLRGNLQRSNYLFRLKQVSQNLVKHVVLLDGNILVNMWGFSFLGRGVGKFFQSHSKRLYKDPNGGLNYPE